MFGSDQGLVGQFNDVVADYAPKRSRRCRASAGVGGRRARSGAPGGRRRRAARLFRVPNSVKAIAPLVGRILLETEAQHSQAPSAELQLFHNRPGDGRGYEPVEPALLPLDATGGASSPRGRWPTEPARDPGRHRPRTLRALIREYLFISLFRACAESLASENASRLAAMQRADKNIDELLEQLHGTFHRLRQSSIDEELFDVVAGFEALSHESRV